MKNNMIYVNDFCINCEAIQSLSIEKQLNRPPDGDLEACGNYFRSIISSKSIRNKFMILAGVFNKNELNFDVSVWFSSDNKQESLTGDQKKISRFLE